MLSLCSILLAVTAFATIASAIPIAPLSNDAGGIGDIVKTRSVRPEGDFVNTRSVNAKGHFNADLLLRSDVAKGHFNADLLGGRSVDASSDGDVYLPAGGYRSIDEEDDLLGRQAEGDVNSDSNFWVGGYRSVDEEDHHVRADDSIPERIHFVNTKDPNRLA